jgi:nucleoside-diphosphate-sugar epimerase
MKVLVTGGSGFLGGAVCRLLHARGDEVVSFARTRSPTLLAAGIKQIEADLGSLDQVTDASKGFDAIVHCAAKAGAWGALEDFYRANVAGTDNVIAACFMNGIGKLVYTSTPSVVHAGRDIEGGNESLPYAEHFSAHYPRTKCIAEQRVLHANGPDLASIALRPHLIFGPGDRHLFPRIVARGREGKLRFIGEVPKRVDVTYIDNAAQAHLDALDRLAPGAACAGRAYFISQGQPIVLDEMVNHFLRIAGLPSESRRIGAKLAAAGAKLCETTWSLLRLRSEPPLTRFLVEQLSTAHWFDISAARRDLGYAPKASISEGLSRLSEWWIGEGRRAL